MFLPHPPDRLHGLLPASPHSARGDQEKSRPRSKANPPCPQHISSCLLALSATDFCSGRAGECAGPEEESLYKASTRLGAWSPLFQHHPELLYLRPRRRRGGSGGRMAGSLEVPKTSMASRVIRRSRRRTASLPPNQTISCVERGARRLSSHESITLVGRGRENREGDAWQPT